MCCDCRDSTKKRFWIKIGDIKFAQLSVRKILEELKLRDGGRCLIIFEK